ncbi:uncharacterized protein BJX67DRAFT_243059 [Aspergillus lucknowensis]|uniref:Uncharacterized protein n=1 Tax=Aspergillus lucknowensis TaxID=176173 RepID=A0ABR4M2I1_9EURO
MFPWIAHAIDKDFHGTDPLAYPFQTLTNLKNCQLRSILSPVIGLPIGILIAGMMYAKVPNAYKPHLEFVVCTRRQSRSEFRTNK